jgi:hypothetical protein
LFDFLTAIEALDDIFGSVSKSPPVHVNRLLVVGLKHDPHFNVEHTITPQEYPACPTRQHGALELGADEAAPFNTRDAARAIGCLAQHKDWYVERNRKQKLGGDPGH